jgi:hypothetical protein
MMAVRTWGKQWDHIFDVVDIFHNESLSFEEKRIALFERMKAQPWFDEFEATEGIAYDLRDEQDVDEWDGLWEQFYDWCDDGKKVWVQTR